MHQLQSSWSSSICHKAIGTSIHRWSSNFILESVFLFCFVFLNCTLLHLRRNNKRRMNWMHKRAVSKHKAGLEGKSVLWKALRQRALLLQLKLGILFSESIFCPLLFSSGNPVTLIQKASVPCEQLDRVVVQQPCPCTARAVHTVTGTTVQVCTRQKLSFGWVTNYDNGFKQASCQGYSGTLKDAALLH